VFEHHINSSRFRHKSYRNFSVKIADSRWPRPFFLIFFLRSPLLMNLQLSYSQWMVSKCFSIKWRYTNIEPLLNSIPIKVERVFLSHKLLSVSSHYLIFHQHIYARQLSNRSILHAGRYLNDKEISYLRTVIVTANVCHSRNELINTGHISQLKYKHL